MTRDRYKSKITFSKIKLLNVMSVFVKKTIHCLFVLGMSELQATKKLNITITYSNVSLFNLMWRKNGYRLVNTPAGKNVIALEDKFLRKKSANIPITMIKTISFCLSNESMSLFQHKTTTVVRLSNRLFATNDSIAGFHVTQL